MNDLYKLTDELGEPKALIDHWDHSSKQFAIWDFDETFEITHDGIPLINDKKYISNPLNLLQETLDNWKNDSQNISAIGYISYDLKNLLYPKINFRRSNLKAPLLWFGKPKKILPYKIEKTNRDIIKNSLVIKKDIPHPIEYEKSIKKIKKYLQNGVSYQIEDRINSYHYKYYYSENPFSNNDQNSKYIKGNNEIVYFEDNNHEKILNYFQIESLGNYIDDKIGKYLIFK